MIFFTSDTHFHHQNVLKYCPNRKFSTIEEHDDFLVSAWNRKVGPKDTVYHLGDVFLNVTVEEAVAFLKRLNGQITLITGNHDKRNLKNPEFRACFKEIWNTYHELKIQYKGHSALLVLCHYPLETWVKKHYGSYHLHGHVHSAPGRQKIRVISRRLDVGVDGREDLAPWSKEELLQHLEIQPTDLSDCTEGAPEM